MKKFIEFINRQLRALGLAGLPDTATAPFCPSEVQGSVDVPDGLSFWQKIRIFLGPGLLVSVGYMDPGNWATDIEAGSKYGYRLLFVILLSSVVAMFLQSLCFRVGVITNRDLAQLSRERFNPKLNLFLWIMAEIAIIMTDIAEVLGSGLAFHLLIGCSLEVGIMLTALDTLIILGLKGRGFRQIEAIVLGLVSVIGICYLIELFIVKPYWPEVFKGFIPSREGLSGWEPWYLSLGILGATVMPHNIYLHSSVVQTRKVAANDSARRESIALNTLDTMMSLSLAFMVNAAILILAATAFHKPGQTSISGIEDAYQLLTPIAGGASAALFALALLAAGQSATFTGTIAGQVVMEGFMRWKIPCWQRRLITRGLALGPALLGVMMLGDHAVNKMLVFSQVVLSIQLPFAVWPLLKFASDQRLMGQFCIGDTKRSIGWLILLGLIAANIALFIS